jgi:hypothetical protein
MNLIQEKSRNFSLHPRDCSEYVGYELFAVGYNQLHVWMASGPSCSFQSRLNELNSVPAKRLVFSAGLQAGSFAGVGGHAVKGASPIATTDQAATCFHTIIHATAKIK